MSRSIRLRAFAKINLGLKILSRRPDGYHEIRTIYQSLRLHDRLTLTVSPLGRGIRVVSKGEGVPSGPENLVYKACAQWKRAARFRGGIEVQIDKFIPAGSGLGGASSDAAAVLAGLEQLTGGKMDVAKRLALASSLGSDVPFFLLGGRALGCGRGEEVYPLAEFRPVHCLVVFPGFKMLTADAYRQASAALTTAKEPNRIDSFGVWSRLPWYDWGPAENDFERVVFAKWPELGRLKSQLIRAGAETACLTGSGSAVYAIFSSPGNLLQAKRNDLHGWRTFHTQTLNRKTYHRLQVM
ncbi:MAG TPA: 4-(cytidine 5'-diphospho)-2-C-methyl-D-erythritol kinase [Terriglobia bacterium]|nr:4-(cytidine 5'-diphospho)-2-C-methyl-D-erythritol kinase [Terriglobia bacterium]